MPTGGKNPGDIGPEQKLLDKPQTNPATGS